MSAFLTLRGVTDATDVAGEDPDEKDPLFRANGTYRAARIGTALAITGVMVLLLVLDALSPDYDMSPVTLTALLTTVLTLLGIEVGASFFGRRR